MLTKILLAGLMALTAAPASATFVIQCYSRLYDERADPVVNPNYLPSPHVHAIAGGSGFKTTMTYEDARASKCGTCNVKEDLSNYWTPKLYYHAEDGSFESVPIDGDAGGNMGGMAIYYLHRPGPDNDVLHPFPKGFRMVAGDPFRRSFNSSAVAERAVSHRCIGTSLEPNGFPDQNCPEGIRTQIVMPSCWDGVNLDSPDHKSHMSYPIDGDFDGGRCPKSHPVHLMTLFYEVTYRTDSFSDRWYGDKQPFVLANGDGTGYGYHGDFVNGWDIDVLAKGVKNCVDGTPDCPGETFTFYDQGETQACKLDSKVGEQVSGTLDKLPGCNAVTHGPERAAMVSDCAMNHMSNLKVSAFPNGIADLTSSKGWKYLGCGTDNAGDRTFDAAWTGNDDMTQGNCVDFCDSKGYSYAGLEFGTQCYCGSSLASDRKPVEGMAGNCVMTCAGEPGQMCGGPDAVTMFQKCPSGGCGGEAKREVEKREPAMTEFLKHFARKSRVARGIVM
ncbi:WSC-domain-containing protein [Aulographum hederae CBS 113979]|uniref:WSC-domain-containing protein n=1 Tax=Aulographum hederae CBS 113979 TaxID=1176131 RepID=A0A6G1HFQ0_9PEZI|nr:WSC-domain-containing protein [Aulographum hederae CBS 113979]